MRNLSINLKAINLPPVLHELVGIAPDDFKWPVIYAALPMLGVHTSYLRAKYIDGEIHSTTFFTSINAMPSAGKSFIKKLERVIMPIIRERDILGKRMWAIYMRQKAKDASVKPPTTPTREAATKSSESQFLMEMKNCQGHMMISIESEIDSFIKGMKAAQGDKSDMMRMAYDQDPYSQRYITSDTFNGDVILAWNILLTGTPNQQNKLFHNVEDGLVTRFSFCNIDRPFASFETWGELTTEQLGNINEVFEFCDRQTYAEPLNFNMYNLDSIDDDELDAEGPYQYTFKPFYEVDLSWSFPMLEEWLENERRKAIKAIDHARDDFRKRVAVKGFRLILLCYALCKHEVGETERQLILNFVKWFMDVEIENMLEEFGAQYRRLYVANELKVNSMPQANLYACLNDEFTKEDVIQACADLGIGSPVRNIISTWKSHGMIEQLEQRKRWKKLH